MSRRTLALVLALGGSLAWADVAVLSLEFEPPEFTPGQIVLARAVWDPAGTRWTAERVSTGFPEPGEDGPSVLYAETLQRGGRTELVVAFIAWKPGQGALPPLYVGGAAFPPLEFQAGSILPAAGRHDPGMLPQLEPKGLRTNVYVAAGALLAAGMAAALIAYKLLPWLKILAARWAFQKARRDFEAVLAFLRGGAEGPAAWAALASALRRYLNARSELDFFPLTAREVAALPDGVLPGQVTGDAAVILSASDYVRFGSAGAGDLPAAVELAAAVVTRVEEALADTEAGRKPA